MTFIISALCMLVIAGFFGFLVFKCDEHQNEEEAKREKVAEREAGNRE